MWWFSDFLEAWLDHQARKGWGLPTSNANDQVFDGAEVVAEVTATGVEVVASVACEPVDWGTTIFHCLNDDCSVWAIAAAATPFIPARVGHLAGEAIEQGFKHAWIKRDLFKELPQLVGKADVNKFKAALKKGVVGPIGESGIKKLSPPVGRYTHELKINGSAQRLLGSIDENGVMVFDRHVPGGLH